MDITTRRIDDLGRIQIPKNLRALLDIHEGDRLDISANAETKQIIIEKTKQGDE